MIATYALCGFSNIGSMGIFLGGMSALVPSRRGDLAQIVVRAMVAGNVACFLTGCIAGQSQFVLYCFLVCFKCKKFNNTNGQIYIYFMWSENLKKNLKQMNINCYCTIWKFKCYNQYDNYSFRVRIRINKKNYIIFA